MGSSLCPAGLARWRKLFEIITWGQIGLHNKPIGLLNTNHYFDSLLVFIEQARSEGFIEKGHQDLFTITENPEKLLSSMIQYEPPADLSNMLPRNG